MKNKELMEILQKIDGEARVLYDDCENIDGEIAEVVIDKCEGKDIIILRKYLGYK